MKAKLHIMLLAAFVLLVSCQHKELCYDHSHIGHVEVEFDWSNDKDAAPETMSLYLFPENGGDTQRYEFIGRNGGTIRVKRGLYKAICVNSDSRDHEIHDVEDFGDFCISTCDALSVDGLNTFGISTRSLPKARGTEDERMALAPEMVWSDFIGTIDLTDRSQKIILYPKPQVYTCNVEIRNATNLKWIKGLSGSLSTMAGGHHPSRETASEECVTIPFSCNYDKEDSIITGSLTTFGHCPTEDRTHFLTIYAILADNSRWSYTFDVTDHVHKSEGMNDIHIILDGLPLPKPVVNGGGFKPVLDDWKEVLIDITM